MWRSQSLEEWERKKSYLIRSLFEDLPILSPILESHEPVSLSISSSLSKCIDRAESPLPELIIEVEPKKPNLHDDPEELYNELAKEMRRLYRKDFLGIELSRSSSEYSISESLNRGRIYDNTMSDESDSDEKDLDEKDKCQIDYDSPEHQKDIDMDSPTQTDISTSKGSSESIYVASEPVIVHVDVHSQEYETQENLAYEKGFTESQQCRQSGIVAINVSTTTNVNESIESEDDDTYKEEKSASERFAKDTNASSIDSSINPSSHASPDIMRQRQPFVSLETPPYRPVSESNSTVSKTIHLCMEYLSMEVDSKKISEDVLSSDHEIEISEGSGNESLFLVTSTPKRKRTSRFSTKMGPKRRLVSYSSSSLSASAVSAANAALQTSFSDCETNCLFWSNFFIGMPTVYNICSCKDHVCTT